MTVRKKLAIITTHPIQYNAPWFRLLANSEVVAPKVFYTWEQSQSGPKYDPGFGRVVSWDIPLLEGYDYTFVKNTSPQPGSHHYKGIINPSLIDDINAFKPDAILVFGWKFDSHLKVLRHFHNRIPVLFRGDSTLLDQESLYKKIFRKFMLRWVYSHIDFALYVGANNKNYFLQYGLKPEQLIYTPHAIDNDRFAQPADEYENKAGKWRQDLGIQEDDLAILFAGKLENKKNPQYLLELSEKIQSPKLKIIIAGNGVLEKQLKEKTVNDKRFIFLDFQNQLNMPVVYRLGDIFILPSLGPGETWGLALNEAMACGRAVIASDKVGGAIDLITDNKNGIIISLPEMDKCIQFIESGLKNREKITQAGISSLKKVESFSFKHIVQAIEACMTGKILEISK